MRIHHFYPRTNNIGDHFVQRGIEAIAYVLPANGLGAELHMNDIRRQSDQFDVAVQPAEAV